jgi:hypothetical protein
MRTKPALTVAELLLSMAVLAVIGTAVAGLSHALSSAHAHSQDYYSHLQTARNGTLRLQGLFRESLLVTAADDHSAVLWAGDANGDGVINRNEVVLVDWDSTTGEIGTYQVDLSGLSPAQQALENHKVKLSQLTGISVAGQAIRNDPRAQYTPLAEGVTDFALSCSVAPPLARGVSFQLIAGPPTPGERPAALRSAAALRNPQTHRVSQQAGVWVLGPPPGGGGGGGEED